MTNWKKEEKNGKWRKKEGNCKGDTKKCNGKDYEMSNRPFFFLLKTSEIFLESTETEIFTFRKESHTLKNIPFMSLLVIYLGKE